MDSDCFFSALALLAGSSMMDWEPGKVRSKTISSQRLLDIVGVVVYRIVEYSQDGGRRRWGRRRWENLIFLEEGLTRFVVHIAEPLFFLFVVK